MTGIVPLRPSTEEVDPGLEVLAILERDDYQDTFELGAFVFVERSKNAWIQQVVEFAGHPIAGLVRENGAGVTTELVEAAAHAGITKKSRVGMKQVREFVGGASAERAVDE
jgi:hypothetical protein